jgi:hypothetical protein
MNHLALSDRCVYGGGRWGKVKRRPLPSPIQAHVPADLGWRMRESTALCLRAEEKFT